MNVSIVRKIDYWVGIPICFVLDLIYYLSKLNPFKKRATKNPKKFLFIELSEMGSSILTYPTMKYLENKYPNNSAKISNFWGTENHGLTEFFVSIKDFKEWDNAKTYKIVNKILTKKISKDADKKQQSLLTGKDLLVVPKNIKPEGITEIKISSIDIKGNNE